MLKTENKNSGVYQIRNLLDGKVYVGSAINFKRRCNRHYTFLLKGINSIHLQRAWNLHGEDNFVFEILEEVTRLENESIEDFKKRLVEDREQYYNDSLEAYDRNKGYCIERKCGSSLGIKRSLEFKDKIRQANLGKKESEETCLKKKISATGNPLYARFQLKGGESMLAVKILQYDLDGNFIKEWDSIVEAVQYLHLKSHTGIVQCCQQQESVNTVAGYMWRYHTLNYPKKIDAAVKQGSVFEERYGVGSDGHDELMEKRRGTSLDNYGVSHHMQLDEYKKFGDLNPMKNEEIKRKVGKSGSNTKALKLIGSLLPVGHKFKELIGDEYTIECPLCNRNFQIGRPLLHLRKKESKVICVKCNPLKKNQHK